MAPTLLNSVCSSARPSLRASPAVSTPQARAPAPRSKRHSSGRRSPSVSTTAVVTTAQPLASERSNGPALQFMDSSAVSLPLKQATQQQAVQQQAVVSAGLPPAVSDVDVPVAEHKASNIVCAPVAVSLASCPESSSKALDAAAAPWTPPTAPVQVHAAASTPTVLHSLSPSDVSATQLLPSEQQPAAAADAEYGHASASVSVADTYVADMSLAATSVADMSQRRVGANHNSVVIKADTMVKNAAGAITKVLDRILCMFVTTLKGDMSHEALNRGIKALAVARKYIKDADPGMDLSFLPLNRSDAYGIVDPLLFGFLVFKTAVAEKLLDHDETDLNVSRGSDPKAIANAIIHITLERGQAVMKAGGADALFVAMTAVINARRRLKRKHGVDVMLVPAWITEDTVSTLGRESKFLRFNIIKCMPNGPVQEATVHPSQGSYEGSWYTGSVVSSP